MTLSPRLVGHRSQLPLPPPLALVRLCDGTLRVVLTAAWP